MQDFDQPDDDIGGILHSPKGKFDSGELSILTDDIDVLIK